MGSISRANSVQDLNCVEQFKEIKPKPTLKDSMEAYRKLENAEHKPKKKDGETELQAPLSEKTDPHRFHSLAQPQVEQPCPSPMLKSIV